jgi:hypothetical protein
MRELGKPKKPLSAFLMYMNENGDRRGTQSFRVSMHTARMPSKYI